MAESHPSARNPDTDYERSDLPLAPIGWMALAVFILVVIAPLVVLAGFVRVRGDVDRELTQRAPPPHLQVDPPRELHAYLLREQHLLDSYGWVDRRRGIAHEPISEAMQQVLHEGIEGFPAGTGGSAAGTGASAAGTGGSPRGDSRAGRPRP